jgi:protein-tyrosine phosphatase
VTIGVLFVCTGGICRSPMAAGVFGALAQRAALGEAFEIASAATYDGHAGNPPGLLAKEAASRRGYDISAIRARARWSQRTLPISTM